MDEQILRTDSHLLSLYVTLCFRFTTDSSAAMAAPSGDRTSCFIVERIEPKGGIGEFQSAENTCIRSFLRTIVTLDCG